MQKQGQLQSPYGEILRRYFIIALTICVIAGMVMLHTIRKTTAIAPAAYTAETPYSAGIQNGRVAIYIQGQDTPALLTDIWVDTLPAADQKALQARMGIASEEDLAKFLEDYGS